MSNKNITFIGLGRIKDQAVLASSFDRINAAEKIEIENAFQRYLLEAVSRFSPGAREKRTFGGSTMYLVADRELFCVYAVSMRGSSYPERHAFALLAELVNSVGQHEDSASLAVMHPGSLTKPLRKQFRDMMDKYDNPAKFDATADVNAKVDTVKIVMQDNIKKVLETHENIDRLESKTDNMNQQAAQFHQSANDLRRIMWWRKTKILILIGLVGAAILAYIIIIIANAVS